MVRRSSSSGRGQRKPRMGSAPFDDTRGRDHEEPALESVCTERYRGFESHSLRHSVCAWGDFPRALRHSLRNLRDSAGSWPPDPHVSEPEIAGPGPGRRGVPSSSLLPSQAVRFRSRFVHREWRALHTPRESRGGERVLRFRRSGAAWPRHARLVSGAALDEEVPSPPRPCSWASTRPSRFASRSCRK